VPASFRSSSAAPSRSTATTRESHSCNGRLSPGSTARSAQPEPSRHQLSETLAAERVPFERLVEPAGVEAPIREVLLQDRQRIPLVANAERVRGQQLGRATRPSRVSPAETEAGPRPAAKSLRKRKAAAWKSLPPAELVAHLLATPTITDPPGRQSRGSCPRARTVSPSFAASCSARPPSATEEAAS
jgi:hypothetical protein